MADDITEASVDTGVTPSVELDLSRRENERLRADFEHAARFGRRVVEELTNRRQEDLSLFIADKPFPKEDWAAVIPRKPGQQLDQADVAEALRGSFALALETTFRIAEARPMQPRGGMRLNKEVDSLDGISRVVDNGLAWGREVRKGRPRIIADEVKKALARRGEKPEKLDALTDEQLENIAAQGFRQASAVLSDSRDSLDRARRIQWQAQL